MDLTNSHVFVDGHLVSAKAQRVVQALHDYEPELEVKWVPPGARSEGQAAYAIIHNPPNQPPYVLFYVQNDDEMDERVVRKVIANDQRKGKRRLSDLEAHDEAQALMKRQEYLDRMEEANDIAYHVLKTHKNTYKVNDNLTIRDHGDRVRW